MPAHTQQEALEVALLYLGKQCEGRIGSESFKDQLDPVIVLYQYWEGRPVWYLIVPIDH
jgi:hypothetical protein